MGIKCPKCQFENPDDTLFCRKCGTQVPSPEEVSISHTKTLQTSSKDLLKGSTFAGRYQLIEELGRGGMGVVYKAEDTKLKRTVALKFLPLELTHISEVKERFMREAQAAAALDHTHICTVFEFDEAEEKTFISMAYIEGQSLKKKIESGPFELDEALRIATQVAEGLQEAHKKGVVHRDIKSANIMVTEKGQAKIMDFGLARMTGGTLLTKEGMAMGTIAYMSPEQARGEEVDHRTDIWSFGVVLYEMFGGQLPFKGEQDQAVVYSILNEKPKPITDLRSEIPMAIEQVVGKALEKNADERYQQIDDLLDDLKSISEGIVPEGIKARLKKAKLLRRKRAILYAGIAGFLIIMTVIALSLFTGRAEAIDAIAVLPLENLTGDPGQEYFVDGVTDELIGQLAQIGALRVISRRSVMQYKGVKKPLPEIARELNVDAVVEGTVYQVGDSVRIRVQLIEALPEERNLWAQTYDRAMTDVLVMYKEMARAIAAKTRVKLTAQEEINLASTRQVNPEAYEAYLKGLYHLSKSPPEVHKSLEYFRQAIDIEPTYAPAYAGLADSYNRFAIKGQRPPREAYPMAKAALLKALELDETLAEAHALLGVVKFRSDWDWEGAERELKRALQIEPNSSRVHLGYGVYLLAVGRMEEYLAHNARHRELDPLSPFSNINLARALYLNRRYDEAIAQFHKTLELDPDSAYAYVELGESYAAKKMYSEAIAACEKALELMPEDHVVLSGYGRVYGLSGRHRDAVRAFEKLVSLSARRYVDPYRVASLAAAIYTDPAETNRIFEWLERAYEERSANLCFLKFDPAFDSLRDDPRFQDLLRRMNLPELE